MTPPLSGAGVAALIACAAGIATWGTRANAQGSDAAPAVHVLREAGDGEARHVVALAGGGFAVVGHASGGSRPGIVVLKLSPAGTVQWERRFGRAGDIGFALRETVGGGLAIAGWSADSAGRGTRMLLLRLSSAGDSIGAARVAGAGNARATDLRVLPDGFVLVGQTSTVADSLDAIVVRTDTAGSLRWRTVLGGARTDRAFYVDTLPGGDLAVVGLTTTAPAQDADLLVARLDGSGAVRWRRALGGPGYQTSHGVMTDTAGRIVVLGYGTVDGRSDNDGFALYLTADGNSTGRVVWGGGGDDRVLLGAVHEGNVYATGYTRDSATAEWTSYVVRVAADRAGIQWHGTLDRPGAQAAGALAIGNGRLVVVGYEDRGDGMGRDVMIFLTDTAGRGLRSAVLPRR